MKKTLLITFIFIYTLLNGNCRGYSSMLGIDSTNWSVLTAFIDGCGTYQFDTYAASDTSINNVDYKIIYSNSFISGFLREDTVAGKAWFTSAMTNTEYLIMDLSLQLNDTFYVHTWGMTDSVPAVVDSIYLSHGLKHVRMNYYVFTTNQIKFEFIEGTGPNAGLDYQELYNAIQIEQQLLCKADNSIIIYLNIEFNGQCNVMCTNVSDLINEQIKIYPNPVRRNQTLSLHSEGEEIKSVSLYDLRGIKISESRENDLRIEEAPGLYLLKIIFFSGRTEIKKLVIND